MGLKPATRLGPYEVIAPIGAGGMGEVYRARDTRLDREVAIKVLPPAVAADPVRRRRFEVEARAVAALSHPHICPVHDIGAMGDLDYLVLELLHGETLAARLGRGPMPAAEAVARAVEIADAMAVAHARGVVHRDLKPGNVMLTRSGAFVLDFGLARIVRDDPSRPGDSVVTATSPLTGTGVVVGTLHYMAPEQIEGREVDARADIFAFGAVLFEMLTARKAFEGSSGPAVMGAIIRADAPSAVAVWPELPASVDRLLRACLAKAPDDRLASMHDVRMALEWIQDDVRTRQMAGGPIAATSAPARLALIAGAAAIVLVGLGAFFYGRRSVPIPAVPASYVYDIALPPALHHWEGLAVSQDGRRLAVITQPAPGLPRDPRLWVRDLSSIGPWELVSGAGDELPHYPFWSPDGRSLAFFLKGHLVRVALPSVIPVEICAADDGRGGVWIDDNTIVFAPSPASALMKVDVRTGQQEELVARASGELGPKYPSAAGTRRVIYWVNYSDAREGEVRLVSLDAPDRPVTILKSAAAAVYDRGTLFYLRSGLWVGQPFDVETVQLAGEPRPVAIEQPWSGNIGAPALSAQRGVIAAASTGLRMVQATWRDRTGKTLGTLGQAAALAAPAISPDGARLAMVRTEQGEIRPDLWVVDLATGAPRRLTTAAAAGSFVWRPDGRRIVLQSQTGVGRNNNLFEVDVEGADRPRPLIGGLGNLAPVGWLPGPGRFVFSSIAGNTTFPRGILIRDVAGGHDTPYRLGEAEPIAAALSPDGSRIAFAEVDFGGADLYVDFIPRRGGQPVRVWHGPAQTPRWSADGREILFVAGERLMAARVSSGPELTAGPPTRLFDVPSADYAIDPKTGRFLVLVPTIEATPSITITVNWPR